jgi:hypothetical protein
MTRLEARIAASIDTFIRAAGGTPPTTTAWW